LSAEYDLLCKYKQSRRWQKEQHSWKEICSNKLQIQKKMILKKIRIITKTITTVIFRFKVLLESQITIIGALTVKKLKIHKFTAISIIIITILIKILLTVVLLSMELSLKISQNNHNTKPNHLCLLWNKPTWLKPNLQG